MSPAPANADLIRAQLRSLEASEAFRESSRHRTLLAFLLETTLKGEAAQLKEFTIAAEVWGRDVSFDPRIHSMVRVEIGRLRARLERYYTGEGARDLLRFRIPVGGYRVVWDDTDSGSPAVEPVRGSERFELRTLLGRGGMGEVWKARDTRLGRDVAVKFIADDLVRNDEAVRRFEQEARAAAATNHPNICTVYDIAEIQSRPVLAMELLEGHTLKQILERGVVPPESLLRWGIEIAEGLEAAHSAGVIHGDLKPANLFVTERGQAKILDFGLAQLRHQTAAGHTDDVAGTPGYMSPEQARGESLDIRTDLFSFGAVLYEMAMGVRWGELSVEASHTDSRTSQELKRILAKALEGDREVRYQHASDLGADLKRLRRDSDSGFPSSQLTTPAAPGRKTRLRKAVIGFAGLAAAITAAVYFNARSGRQLTGNRVVVLSEFSNTTGDPVFDDALRQGLSAQLEQSPFVTLLPESRIRQTLPSMAQPKNAKVTAALARDVCRRTGGAATVEGSISALGSEYVLGLQAVNCRTGDVLVRAQETAKGKEQVMRALGKLAANLRRRLGESLSSVEKYDTPPEGVTTGSLEALEAYSQGMKELAKSGVALAVERFERATQLDPEFAMAYGRMGVCYASLGNQTKAAESTRKAYQLRARVSERERFYLVSHFDMFVTGNMDAARKTLETWAQIYPDDANVTPNLVKTYFTLGEYPKALILAQKYRPVLDVPLVTAYLYLNRVDEADGVLKQAAAEHRDVPFLHLFSYEIAFMRRDPAGMAKEVASVMEHPELVNFMLDLEAYSAAYAGQFSRARELWQQASDNARRSRDNEEAAGYLATDAFTQALAGNAELAASQARSAMALSSGKDVERFSAVALALAGDLAEAQRVADVLYEGFPEDTLVRINRSMVAAAILEHRGDPQSAANHLAAVARYELGGSDLPMTSAYRRGLALLEANQGPAAAVVFRNILDHPGVTRNFVIAVLAELGLGRAEARNGSNTNARTHYARFFAAWKDCDPNLPLMREARKEFAALKN